MVSALSSEMVIEELLKLKRLQGPESTVWRNFGLGNLQNRTIGQSEFISHAVFKECTKNSKAITRTGETTPYCNVILIAGVAF